MKYNILLFIDWFLPGTASGGPVRSIANMVQHLEQDCDFYVVTRNSDYCSTVPYDVVVNEWCQISSNLQVIYLTEELASKNNYRHIFKTVDVHAIYINGIYSWKFSIMPLLAFRKMSIPIIIGARGMLNPQAFSVKPLKKKMFLKLANLMNLYKNVNFHATNQDEAFAIKTHVTQFKKIFVAPNLPRLSEENYSPKYEKTSGSVKLVSLARISKEKGTLHTLKSLIGFNKGYISLDLYGSIYDQTYWEDCLKVIERLPELVTVNYKGVLKGADVPETLTNYHFFIMPSEGENFGHSILEALSVGLPVIISNKTPWQSLEEKNVGWDLSLSDMDAFRSALHQVVEMDEKEFSVWSNKSKQYAEEIIHDTNTIKKTRLMLGVK